MRPWSGVLLLVCSFACLLAAGCAYGWSLFVPGLLKMGWTMAQTQWVFGVIIATMSLVQLVAAGWLRRYSVARLTTLSALLVACGFGLSFWANGSFWATVLGIGVLTGCGIGISYLTHISHAVACFPQRKGLASGMVVAGYGLGAAWLAFLFGPFTEQVATPTLFGWVGLVNGGLMLLAAALIGPLTRQHLAEQQQVHNQTLRLLHETTGADNQDADGTSTVHQPSFSRMVRAQMLVTCALKPLKRRGFLSLFIGMLAGTMASFLLIGALKPVGLGLGFSTAIATAAVQWLAVGNCFGRFLWGMACDTLKGWSLPASLAFQTLALLLLWVSPQLGPSAYLVAVALFGMGFGSNFVVYATQLAERYGGRRVGALYPLIIQAQGLSALVAPAVAGRILDIDLSLAAWLMVLAASLTATGLLTTSWLDWPRWKRYARPWQRHNNKPTALMSYPEGACCPLPPPDERVA